MKSILALEPGPLVPQSPNGFRLLLQFQPKTFLAYFAQLDKLTQNVVIVHGNIVPVGYYIIHAWQGKANVLMFKMYPIAVKLPVNRFA